MLSNEERIIYDGKLSELEPFLYNTILKYRYKYKPDTMFIGLICRQGEQVNKVDVTTSRFRVNGKLIVDIAKSTSLLSYQLDYMLTSELKLSGETICKIGIIMKKTS